MGLWLKVDLDVDLDFGQGDDLTHAGSAGIRLNGAFRLSLEFA